MCITHELWRTPNPFQKLDYFSYVCPTLTKCAKRRANRLQSGLKVQNMTPSKHSSMSNYVTVEQ